MTTSTLLVIVAIAAPFVLFMLALAWADVYSRGAQRNADAVTAGFRPAELEHRKAA